MKRLPLVSDLPSHLPYQSHHQINPAICLLSSPSQAVESYSDNWITTVIDSATNLWFLMRAEPSELLSSLLVIPAWPAFPLHSSCPTTHSPGPQLFPPLPAASTWCNLLLLRALCYQAGTPPLPSSTFPNLSRSLLIKTSCCIWKKESWFFLCPYNFLIPLLPASVNTLFHQHAFSLLFNLSLSFNLQAYMNFSFCKRKKEKSRLMSCTVKLLFPFFFFLQKKKN